ncbi:MAG: hypothetical protein CL949_12150 [Erythrobacter sp.]|nr:hypothetical protein [Erythrobacter sp.]|tara:strand:- start:2312 stop:3982 length:1671 start_codon:yes stop_codon:yes gene_type:complete
MTIMHINAVTSYEVDGPIASIIIDSPPVNTLSADVRSGLFGAFSRAASDDAIDAVILACAGRTFIAGAEITEFGQQKEAPSLEKIQDLIQKSRKPVIAAIHGTALGGGLELALVCHYRVATHDARVGLPEVKLGLVPGAGGTQRLPRIIGIAAALDLLVSGRSIGAEEARSLGLVDLVVQEGPLLPAAKTFAHHIASRPAGKSQTRDRAREEYLFDPSVFQSFEKENMETFRGYLAPQAILRCVEAAASLPLEAGLEKERREFELLVQSPHSLALRHLFFADRQAFKLPFQVSSPDKLAPAITLLGAVDAIPDQLPSPFKAAITRAGLTLTSAVTDDSYLLCMGTDVEAALMRHKPTAQQPLFVLAPEANENFPVLLNENSDALFGLVPLERNGALTFIEIIAARGTASVGAAHAMNFAKTLGVQAIFTQADGVSIAENQRRAFLDAVQQHGDQQNTKPSLSQTTASDALLAFGFSPTFCNQTALTASTNAPGSDIEDALSRLAENGQALADRGDIARLTDLDVLWTSGLGWPRYRGGPQFWHRHKSAFEKFEAGH